MEENTIRFKVIDNKAEIKEILSSVYHSLVVKGYNPINQLVGYITLGAQALGSRGQYRQVVDFQVSQEHRGMGVGRQLFTRLCSEAKSAGIPKLYISAHSSKESQAAYRALGCTHAQEIIPAIAEEEPCDVQMEYVL